MEETGPLQRGHQEEGARVLLLVRSGLQGTQVQPGQDLQVKSASVLRLLSFLILNTYL